MQNKPELIKMPDIFDNKILCRNCGVAMRHIEITRNGFILRVVECSKCGARIIHPKDEQEYNAFNNLKKKQFVVKMRFVGNSYAVSIPKEIVDFMKDQEKIMDDMVKLCFEEFGILRLNFACNKNGNGNDHNGNSGNSHSISNGNKLNGKVKRL